MGKYASKKPQKRKNKKALIIVLGVVAALMAAVVAVSLPLIVLFLIFRKKIMAGVAQGGTKG